MSTGLLVSVEGIDGSGKTTLCKNIVKKFKQKGVNVYLTKEPGDNPIGVLHRSLSKDLTVSPYVRALISSANRYYENDLIKQLLNLGYLVISDRYYLSGLAYHHADGVSMDWYASVNEKVLKPHLVLFLDIDLKVALLRLGKSRDFWDRNDFLGRVKKSYELAIDYLSKSGVQIKRLDGNSTQEEVMMKAYDIIEDMQRNQ